ncbi:MAG: hypothetical protein JW885_01695 [Deltaproteobacteria bacterium]|nr:hypothetical protein [Candidatus Zymogenaceae bacterium]
MKASRTYTLLIVAVLLLTLTACAPSMIPASTPGAVLNVDDKTASITQDGITITVVSDAWRYEPADVKYLFTPLYVQVQNNTDEEILISRATTLLFDEYNTQYGALTPEEVDRAVTPLYEYPPVVFWGGAGYYWGWDDWAWGLSSGYPYYIYPHDYYTSRVIPKSFRYGLVAPGARVMGFVYFQEPDPIAQRLTVSITPEFSDGTRSEFRFNFIIMR